MERIPLIAIRIEVVEIIGNSISTASDWFHQSHVKVAIHVLEFWIREFIRKLLIMGIKVLYVLKASKINTRIVSRR